MPRSLILPAIRYKQGKGHTLYSFVVEGKRIPDFANIIRIGRKKEQANELFGYQRPEVFSHIREIKRYLESPNPLMPNSLVVAFDKKVKFAPGRTATSIPRYSTIGTIEIPIPRENEDKIGWIVDGQQRTAAIRDSMVKSFPVAMVGFQANEEEQREQFILVNSTKPLPKDLIYELLPTTDTRLALGLEKKKLPSLICNELNFSGEPENPAYPFFGRIKMPTNPGGNISYNSVLKMLSHSLSDGVLIRYLDTNDGFPDIDQMVKVLNGYWAAVADLFQEAWILPPSKSRLTHGAGMIAMGFLMDAICEKLADKESGNAVGFSKEIGIIRRLCFWTKGKWQFGKEWNQIQNIPGDIELLSNYILKSYLGHKLNRK